MFGPWSIPSVGDVQLTWLPNLPPPTPTTTGTPPVTTPGGGGLDSDTAGPKTGSDEDMAMDSTMTGAGENNLPADQLNARKDGGHDVDYDVAEVDDTWGS